MSGSTSPAVAYSSADYAMRWLMHLPPGKAYPRDTDTMLYKVGLAIGDAFAALHASSLNLSEVEADPAQTMELLSDWMRDYGLPDPCTPDPATLQQQHSALLAWIGERGGQSIAYFVRVAAALGYAITITECRAWRVGMRVGQPLKGPPWDYAWQVNGPLFTLVPWRVGQPVGEPLVSWTNTPLQCSLRRLAPAQTIVLFNYTG